MNVLHPIIFLFFTWVIMIAVGMHYGQNHNLDSVIVKFDPCISILDRYNHFRYNDSELFPLIDKVATKFTKILVQLSEIDLIEDLQTSASRLPSAIAQYNKRNHNDNFTKLEVWLSYISANLEAPYDDPLHSKPVPLIAHIKTLADEANFIFNGTVTTIILPGELLKDLYTKHNSTFQPKNYKLGISMDSKACEYLSGYVNILVNLINPQLVIVIMRSIFEEALSNGNTIEGFDKTLNKCQLLINNKTLAFFANIPDTSTNQDAVNMTRLVYTWYQLINWSREKNTIMIISKAFDTPCEVSTEHKTSGWWRLVENSMHKPSFHFEEKAIIALEVDQENNPKNYNWLRKFKNFNRNNLGIILSAYGVNEKRDIYSVYPEDATSVLLDKLIASFSKVVLLIQDDSSIGAKYTLYDTQIINRLKRIAKNDIEVILFLMPEVSISEIIRGAGNQSIEKAAMYVGIDKYLFSTYIIPYTGNDTFQLSNYTNYILLDNLDRKKVRVGYAFNISICLSQQRFYNEDIETINTLLRDTNTILIYFEEDEEFVKLGARRLVQQRTALLSQCKNIFLKNSEINMNTEFIFVMLHYSTQLKFYTDPWRLQNFVRYWDLLTDWATNTNTTLILSNAIDGTRHFKAKGGPLLTEVGWWRFLKDSGPNVPKTTDNNGWVDKRQDALLVSLQHFPEIHSELALQTEHIILIVLVPLIVAVALITLALYFMRRYYQETNLTKSEMDEFFLGCQSGEGDDGENECDRAHKVAYDKSRYEIDENSFTLDEGSALGVGEFGKVCKGKIKGDEGPLNVAIKTGNPEKFHKTALNGMLSEIKLLSYLGKHVNIIELIGANTADLRHGKVFLFLELCHLGSLEKHLRKIRPINIFEDKVTRESADLGYANVMNPAELNSDQRIQKYLNLITLKKAILDSELSEDLYRWSKEICNGMAYLASMHVVHADLATRNVLLNLRKEAKICDFGLSRRMYNYTNYVKHQQEPLPWKWMSPESLKLMQFCEKSDVWAYGVTLWEIYSLGDTPYPGLSWDINFASLLESGFRLNEPTYNEKNMYLTMKDCWNINPVKRPTFSDLLNTFI